MRERGRYQLQLMKTRSSSGVGSKIDLGFDVDTLRIYDIDEDDDSDNYQTSSGNSTIMDTLKRSSTSETTRTDPTQGNGAPKVRAETDSTKLRNFINNLSGDDN